MNLLRFVVGLYVSQRETTKISREMLNVGCLLTRLIDMKYIPSILTIALSLMLLSWVVESIESHELSSNSSIMNEDSSSLQVLPNYLNISEEWPEILLHQYRLKRRTINMPEILMRQYHHIQRKARQKLVKSIEFYEKNPYYLYDTIPLTEDQRHWLKYPFEDVMVSLPLAKELIHASDGHGGEDKYFVGPDALREIGSEFIVYGAGINNNANFELYLASLGASVFAFDCTVLQPKKEWWSIRFYSW